MRVEESSLGAFSDDSFVKSCLKTVVILQGFPRGFNHITASTSAAGLRSFMGGPLGSCLDLFGRVFHPQDKKHRNRALTDVGVQCAENWEITSRLETVSNPRKLGSVGLGCLGQALRERPSRIAGHAGGSK